MNAQAEDRRETRPAAGDAGGCLAWPGDPEGIVAADIDFEALAHVLANTCRFGGRTRQYHSLAAHAVTASEEIEALDGLGSEDRRMLAVHALIADAPSAWLRGDTRAAEASQRAAKLAAAIERAVREAAGLDPVLGEDHAELLRFVFRMTAAAERRDLADADTGPGAAFPPLRRRIRAVGPGRAAKVWLARFRALSGPPRETLVSETGAGTGTTVTGKTKGGTGDESNVRTGEGTEGNGSEHGETRQAA